jgi:hypothetical protein
MATQYFEGFMGGTPDWTDLGANTIVWCSSLTDLATYVTVGQFQDGTHAGSDDPGTDQCGANHMNNVKYLTSSTMSVNGAAGEDIDDTNLAANECTLRLHFNHGSNVDVTNGVFFSFDGSTPTTPATGMDIAAFERGRSATAWTVINDDTVAGAFTNGSIGGNNTGERLDLADSSDAQDHYWNLAVSFSPESVGAKTAQDFGWNLVYS